MILMSINQQLKIYQNNSLWVTSELIKKIGYDKAAILNEYASTNNISLEQANKKLKYLSQDDFNQLSNITSYLRLTK